MSRETAAETVCNVVVNGEPHRFPAGTTLLEVVHSIGLPEDRLAIEFKREIVSRALWDATLIDEGAEIEIVQFVGGG